MEKESIKINIGNWIGIEAQSPGIYSLLIVFTIALVIVYAIFKYKGRKTKKASPKRSLLLSLSFRLQQTDHKVRH